MHVRVAELESVALGLPREERRRIANALMASLDIDPEGRARLERGDPPPAA